MRKNYLKSILLSLLCIGSFSCSLNMESIRTGTVHVQLEEKLSARNTEASVPENNILYPSEYFITIYSLESKKNVIEQTFSAGDIVIPRVPIGLNEIKVQGRSAGLLFTGSSKFDLQEESMNIKVELSSSRLSGNIKIVIDEQNGKVFDRYFYSILNDKNEYIEKNKVINVQNGKPEETIISNLYSGAKYKIILFGEDESFLYKGIGKAESDFIKADDITTIEFNKFEPLNGAIKLDCKGGCNDELSINCSKKDTGEIILNTKINSLPFVIGKLQSGSYTVTVESKNKDVEYFCNEEIVVSTGVVSDCAITAATKTSYYVSESGDDNNFGIETSPFRTIAKVIETAGAKKNISIYVSGSINEPLNIISDKKIEIIGNEKSVENKIIGNITINNSAADIYIKNIEIDDVTLTDGKLSFGNGIKAKSVTLADGKLLNIKGIVENTKESPVILNISNYVENKKVIDTFLPSEMEKFKFSNSKYKLDSYGYCQYELCSISVIVSDFSNYNSGSFRYELYDSLEAKIEENTFTTNNFSTTAILKNGLNYKIVVYCDEPDYSYKGSVSFAAGIESVEIPQLEACTGSLKILPGTATVGTNFTLNLNDGITSKVITVDKLPYVIKNLNQGLYEVVINSTNPDEKIDNAYGKVIPGSLQEISLKAMPANNVWYVNENGDDLNPGVNGSAYATVSKALKDILPLAYASPSDLFTIKVVGTINETKALEIVQNSNIKIEGVGTGATIKSVGSNAAGVTRRVLHIGKIYSGDPDTKPSVTLKNVKITGGVVASDQTYGGGSGVYLSSGILNLEDGVLVEGNTCPSAPEKNAAVYIEYSNTINVSGNVVIPESDGLRIPNNCSVNIVGEFTGSIHVAKYDYDIIAQGATNPENYGHFTVATTMNKRYDGTTGMIALKELNLTEFTQYIESGAEHSFNVLLNLKNAEELKTVENLINSKYVGTLDLTASTSLTAIPANTFNYEAFQSNNDIRIWEIKLPSTIVSIGDNSLSYLKGDRIILPNSLNQVGKDVFRGVESLKFKDVTSKWTGSDGSIFTPTEYPADNAQNFIKPGVSWTKNVN